MQEFVALSMTQLLGKLRCTLGMFQERNADIYHLFSYDEEDGGCVQRENTQKNVNL